MPAEPTTANFWFVPPLQAEAGWIVCRRPRPDDAGALYQAVTFSIEHLRPWMPWAADYTPVMAHEFVERNSAHPGNVSVSDAAYLITDRRGQLLGVSGLHARLGPRALEIGYWVDVRHTRRAVATLAAAALTELAIQISEIEVVEIHHDQANTISGAIPARLGYERLAAVKCEPEAPGEVGVEWQWRMHRRDWPASTGAQLLAKARTTAS